MKNFGFGLMRLPMLDGEVDFEQTSKMVDLLMAEGFNYFDTAHGYIQGRSEIAVKKCLSSRYPRESYILTNKLTSGFFNTKEEIRPLFESQLEACGVEYFDYYLMHSQSATSHKKYMECEAYSVAEELKAEGKIRHIGISFHDKAAVLEQILTDAPSIEVVQIQFNYADYDDPGVEGRECLEVCRKFGKPVIVMEPVKGGCLANLPEEAVSALREVGDGSPASFAIRYAASFDGIMMVISGMSSLEQMEDNLSFMRDFKPLTEAEFAAIEKVKEIFVSQHLIQCTACRYCTDGCPKKIPIPDVFSCMNRKKQFHDWNSEWYYKKLTELSGKASDCIKCGKCEKVCPQHLEIRKLLGDCAAEFEKEEE